MPPGALIRRFVVRRGARGEGRGGEGAAPAGGASDRWQPDPSDRWRGEGDEAEEIQLEPEEEAE